MSKKRQSNSSIVSIMDEDNLDLHEINEDSGFVFVFPEFPAYPAFADSSCAFNHQGGLSL